jgi:hypothetical protein
MLELLEEQGHFGLLTAHITVVAAAAVLIATSHHEAQVALEEAELRDGMQAIQVGRVELILAVAVAALGQTTST